MFYIPNSFYIKVIYIKRLLDVLQIKKLTNNVLMCKYCQKKIEYNEFLNSEPNNIGFNSLYF
jgi:hypothetical protein